MNEDTVNNSLQTVEGNGVEYRDLGFGTVVTGQSRERLLNSDGSFNVRRTGLGPLAAINLYHTLLSMRWRTFLLLLLLFPEQRHVRIDICKLWPGGAC